MSTDPGQPTACTPQPASVTNNTIGSATINGDVVQAGSIGAVYLSPVRDPAVVPRQLPRCARIVDRITETGLLTKFLVETQSAAAGDTRMLVLTGAGGAGKSALATWWGHQSTDAFPDGQVYANLGVTGTDSEALSAIQADFLHALGVRECPAGVDARSALWRTLTYGRRMLVVLDNADPGLDLRPLLPATTSSVLITSRDPLPDLLRDGARMHSLAPLPPEAAHDLLASMIGAARAEAEPDALAELTQFCGGHALTLAIIGTHLAIRANRSIAATVTALRTPHSRPAAITTAWESIMLAATADLCGPSATLLSRLPAIPRPEGADTVDFSPAVATALLGADAVDALDDLVTRNLLDEISGNGVDRVRYRVPAMVLDHLRTSAAPPDELTAGTLRLREHYLDSAAIGVASTEPGKHRYTLIDEGNLARWNRRATLDWVRAERTNLVAAHQWWLSQGDVAYACRLADALWPLLRQVGDHDGQLAVQVATAEAGERVQHEYASAAWSRAAWVLSKRTDSASVEKAVELGTRAVTCAAWADDPDWALATAFSTRSTAHSVAGNHLAALHDITEALRIDRRRGAPKWVIGLRLRRRALILVDLCRYNEALFDAQRAVTLTVPDTRRPTEAARAYQTLAQVQLAAGQPGEAEAALREALALLTEHPLPLHEAEVHELLGHATAKQGRPQDASDHYRRARDTYFDAGDPLRAGIAEAQITTATRTQR